MDHILCNFWQLSVFTWHNSLDVFKLLHVSVVSFFLLLSSLWWIYHRGLFLYKVYLKGGEITETCGWCSRTEQAWKGRDKIEYPALLYPWEEWHPSSPPTAEVLMSLQRGVLHVTIPRLGQAYPGEGSFDWQVGGWELHRAKVKVWLPVYSPNLATSLIPYQSPFRDF